MSALGVGMRRPAHGISSERIARARIRPNHLSGYKGSVHADGVAGFNGLFGQDKADEQACMVHVRRKFVDTFERTDKDIAKHAITQIADLYAVEKEAKDKTAKERVTLRQERAKPIFNELEDCLQAQPPKISGKPNWPRRSATR